MTGQDELLVDIVNAALDWAQDVMAGQYGPMQRQIKKSEAALMAAVEAYANENDGHFKRLD